MQGLETVKPAPVQPPVRRPVSSPSQNDPASEAALRRRARRIALLLMAGSGLLVVTLIGGLWLVLRA